MARFFPGELISRIHGTARLVDGRLCVAMYHPAAGLHHASLADIIRADFRKLPVFVEQARILLLRDTAPAEELGAPVPSTEYRVPSDCVPISGSGLSRACTFKHRPPVVIALGTRY